jgi:hypothetical protein
MFHRQDMHKMLKDTALQEDGEGTPAQLVVNYEVSTLVRQALHRLETDQIGASVVTSIYRPERSHSRTPALPDMT